MLKGAKSNDFPNFWAIKEQRETSGVKMPFLKLSMHANYVEAFLFCTNSAALFFPFYHASKFNKKPKFYLSIID